MSNPHSHSNRVPADPGKTRFAFTIHATDGKARTGAIAMMRGHDPHAGLHAGGHRGDREGDEARPRCARSGADIILGNTYHLMLRPGAERVATLGGLHALMAGSGRS